MTEQTLVNMGPYESGETCEVSHIWREKGGFKIKARAKDTDFLVSDWSDSLEVMISKKQTNNETLFVP